MTESMIEREAIASAPSRARTVVSGLRLACAAAFVMIAAAPAVAPAAEPQANVSPQDQKRLDEARRHFNLGLAYLRDPDGEQVEGAYLEFKRAYELSRSPRVLGNIGYCAMKLERYGEAVTAYNDYLRLVPNVDSVERTQIQDDLKAMTDGGATLKVSFTTKDDWTLVDTRVPVRGAVVTNTYGPTKEPLELLVRPGHHVVKAKRGNTEEGQWEFDVAGAASASHEFAPAPPKPVALGGGDVRAESHGPGPWIVMGTGAAALAAGAVTGLLALGKMQSLESKCPNNVCPPGYDYESEVSSARTLGTATDVLLIGGGVAVVAGATWYLLSGSKSSGEKRAAPAVQPAAFCAPGRCQASMQWTF